MGLDDGGGVVFAVPVFQLFREVFRRFLRWAVGASGGKRRRRCHAGSSVEVNGLSPPIGLKAGYADPTAAPVPRMGKVVEDGTRGRGRVSEGITARSRACTCFANFHPFLLQSMHAVRVRVIFRWW